MSTFIPDDAWEPPYPKKLEVKIGGEFTTIDLTPEDVDVRTYDNMPLNLKYFLTSGFFHEADDEGFRAGVTLWCRAWHQVPAASLPGDDRQIASMAGYGRDTRGWKRVRRWAMHGFKMATDGRYYHPVLAELALSSFRTIRSQKGNAKRKWERENALNGSRSGGRTTLKSGSPNFPAGRDDADDTQDHNGPRNGEVFENNKDGTMPGLPLGIMPGNRSADATGDATEGRGIEEKESKKERVERTAPKTGSGPSARAGRLPLDWTPSPTLFAMASELGFAPAQIEAMADSFRDYWSAKPGRDGTKLDWDATFRNWIRKEDPARIRAKPSAQPAEINGGGKPHVDDLHWTLRLKGFRDKARWIDLWGPKPTEPLCATPSHLLIEFGYRNPDGSIAQQPNAENLTH